MHIYVFFSFFYEVFFFRIFMETNKFINFHIYRLFYPLQCVGCTFIDSISLNYGVGKGNYNFMETK